MHQLSYVSGTVADGRFGPDLTHLMSRETIASGATANTFRKSQGGIQDPGSIKPGSLMPAMKLNDHDWTRSRPYLRNASMKGIGWLQNNRAQRH